MKSGKGHKTKSMFTKCVHFYYSPGNVLHNLENVIASIKADTPDVLIIVSPLSLRSCEYHKTVDLKTSFAYVAFRHDHDSFPIVVNNG